MNSLTSPKPAPSYVGVDVAKADLQAHLKGNQVAFENTPAGRAKLCQKLQAIPGAHVILEATGGYEQPLVEDLNQASIPVSVVNPAWVRASAQAKGQRAKSDPIDASVLTEYGLRYHPEATPALSPVQRKLAALTQFLRQLIEAQAVAKGQAEHHTDPYVRRRHQALWTTTKSRSKPPKRNWKNSFKAIARCSNAPKPSTTSKGSACAAP